MKNLMKQIYNGIVKENPTFVLMLGMCPSLAVTTSAVNGLGMGLTTLAVLVMSNLMISLLRNIIPDRIRIPAYIIIIATAVTIAQLLLQAYIPFIHETLGIYIPLIVVNCIVMGRAESYASKYNPFLSIADGIGMGLGFTAALTAIGIIRELIGYGTIFGAALMPKAYEPISIFVMAPGAFFVLAMLVALQNRIKSPSKSNSLGDCEGGCGTFHGVNQNLKDRGADL